MKTQISRLELEIVGLENLFGMGRVLSFPGPIDNLSEDPRCLTQFDLLKL